MLPCRSPRRTASTAALQQAVALSLRAVSRVVALPFASWSQAACRLSAQPQAWRLPGTRGHVAAMSGSVWGSGRVASDRSRAVQGPSSCPAEAELCTATLSQSEQATPPAWSDCSPKSRATPQPQIGYEERGTWQRVCASQDARTVQRAAERVSSTPLPTAAAASTPPSAHST